VVAVAVEEVVMTHHLHQKHLAEEMMEVKSPTLMLILLVDLVEVVQVKEHHKLLKVLEKIVLDRILVVMGIQWGVLVAVAVQAVLVILANQSLTPILPLVMVVLVSKFLVYSTILLQHPDQMVVV
jgi:hypothetical protein